MTEVSFYHLTHTPLEKALPMLLEKVLGAGKRAVVVVQNDDVLRQVDKFLWNYKADSFLPHGDSTTGNSDKQPIFLTTKEENPNQATFLVSLDGRKPSNLADYERCLDIFDGHDVTAVESARVRWKSYAGEESLDISYWKQHDDGMWRKSG